MGHTGQCGAFEERAGQWQTQVDVVCRHGQTHQQRRWGRRDGSSLAQPQQPKLLLLLRPAFAMAAGLRRRRWEVVVVVQLDGGRSSRGRYVGRGVRGCRGSRWPRRNALIGQDAVGCRSRSRGWSLCSCDELAGRWKDHVGGGWSAVAASLAIGALH